MTDADHTPDHPQAQPAKNLLLPANVRKYVISVGGGLSSTVELPLATIARYGRENVDMVMCSLPNEDPDVWRLVASIENLTGLKVKMIGDNLTPWDVFHRENFIGNSRIDPCSRILKRETMARYMRENYHPAHTTLMVGITYHEIDRMAAIRRNWTAQGWTVDAPLNDKRYTREYMMSHCRELFGFVPRLYQMDMSHNNCGGGCVKAGKAQWARLLWYLPDVYAWWEHHEWRFNVAMRLRNPAVQRTYSILRDELKTGTVPVTLRQFRRRMRCRWANLLPGFDPFEGLEETPPCVWCEAA